jgi:hypothetical protein
VLKLQLKLERKPMKLIPCTFGVIPSIWLSFSDVNAAGLLNGSFEAPPQITSITEYTTPSGINSAPVEFGWKIESGDVDLLTSDYWQASEGRQSLELNGGAQGSIYQDFTFSSSGRWVVRFDMSANPDQDFRGDGMGVGQRGLRVDFGVPGAVTNIGTYRLDAGPRTVIDMEWVSFVTRPVLVSTGVVYRLQFSSLDSGISGPALDNVEVSFKANSRLRVSEVEFCLDTEPDLIYQIQYQSDLTGGAWLDLLGTNVTGTGATFCVRDSIAAEQPRRFYRAVPVVNR